MADEKRFIITRTAPVARSPYVATEIVGGWHVDPDGTVTALARDIDADGNSDAAAITYQAMVGPEVVEALAQAFVTECQKGCGLPAGALEVQSAVAAEMTMEPAKE